ncbi:MAG: hypothetical protein OEW88_09405 [Gammaproteobacteria bacterium]|nr:hypothetical protein [Gammaproteobacteria bacterium]
MSKRNPAMFAAVYGLALSSILVTRIFRAFTLAEVLAVAAFLGGLLLVWRHRGQQPGVRLALPERLIATGSLVGLAGLPLKLLFIVLGIGAPGHDMAGHESTPGSPLLLHIHHLFFNLGFLMLLISAIAWIAASRESHAG